MTEGNFHRAERQQFDIRKIFLRPVFFGNSTPCLRKNCNGLFRNNCLFCAIRIFRNAWRTLPLPSARARVMGLKKYWTATSCATKPAAFGRYGFCPVALEGRLGKVTLYLSQKRRKKNREKNNDRIILATELESTGPIEIEVDVFERSLSLALRSTRSFSAFAQAGIREQFLQILEVVRMQGSINFYTVSSLSMDTLAPQTAWEVEL